MKLFKILRLLLVCLFALFIFNPAFADLSSDAKIEYNKGIQFYQTGMYSQAADCFKKATEYDPNFIDAYFNLGSLLEYLKQDDDALNAFKQIILRKPDDYEAVYKAAELSKRTGNVEKAIMYLSLIPEDSLIGQRAKELAQSMNVDLATEKANKTAPQSYEDANPMNNNNGVYSDISSPTGVVTDNEGNIYVAAFSDNTIYKIGPDNKKHVYIKNVNISGPIGLVRDSAGNLYIANYNKDNILKVDKSGKVTELISNIPKPYCMHISGNLLFISAQGNNTVVRYKLGN